MDRLWSHNQPMLVREVLEDISAERPLAYTTVTTVLDKLHRKGWLRRQPEGRAYRYEPGQSRDAYSADLMRDALVASTDQRAALVYFVDRMSAAEAEALQAALQAARREPGR